MLYCLAAGLRVSAFVTRKSACLLVQIRLFEWPMPANSGFDGSFVNATFTSEQSQNGNVRSLDDLNLFRGLPSNFTWQLRAYDR